MDPKKVAALAALTLLGVVAVFEVSKEIPPDTKPLTSEKCLQPEKVGNLDGGKAYTCEVRTDAGVELRITTAKCVRATGKATTCQRRLADGGSRYFGALNRFPATEAVGTGCEAVACSVFAGEDADAAEDDVLSIERGGK